MDYFTVSSRLKIIFKILLTSFLFENCSRHLKIGYSLYYGSFILFFCLWLQLYVEEQTIQGSFPLMSDVLFFFLFAFIRPENTYKDPDDGRQRFLLELEFVQCLANPTYIHCMFQSFSFLLGIKWSICYYDTTTWGNESRLALPLKIYSIFSFIYWCMITQCFG